MNHLDSPNWLRLIDKGSRNTLKSRDHLLTFLEEDHLDKDVLITSLDSALKILDFKYINAPMLQPLVPKIGEHNIKKVCGVKRMERVRGVEKMERVREMEEAIEEIK